MEVPDPGWTSGDRVQLLHVVRKDDARDGALRPRDPHRAVDQVAHLLGGRRHVHVLVRDVLEERQQIYLLLILAADRGAWRLADDRDDRLVIHLRVVEAVEQMNRAGTRRREAHADLAGELGVRACHERRHLLMAHLDEAHAIGRALEGAHDAVDAVAGVAVHARHTPAGEPLDQKVADGLSHAEVEASGTPHRSIVELVENGPSSVLV